MKTCHFAVSLGLALALWACGSDEPTDHDTTSAPTTSADTSESDTTTADTRTDDTRTDDTDSVADDSVADDTLADDTLTDDTRADDTLTDDTRVDDTLTDDTRVDDTLTDDTRADDTLTDDTGTIADVGEDVGPPPEPIVFAPFAAASFVVGQADFAARAHDHGGVGPSASGFQLPIGQGLVADGRFYQSDGRNARVLIFEPVPSASDASATAVLASAGLTSTDTVGPNGGDLYTYPRGICSDGVRFGIADPQGSRIELFMHAPSGDAQPDVLVGQPDMATIDMATSRAGLRNPYACALGGGRLAVADTDNHRVLLWDAVPSASAADADRVLGQGDFTSGQGNRGGLPAADSLSSPQHVWTDGARVAVADTGNHRVLLWSSWPASDGQPADVVLGQADFTSAGAGLGASALRSPGFVGLSPAGQLFIGDNKNNRILVHNLWPTLDGAPADQVLGQSDFDHGAADDEDQDGVRDATAGPHTFDQPTGVAFYGNQVWVTDTFNHRVLVFE